MPLNLAALIIGTLVPDFGYYVGLFPLATVAHSLPGSVLVCIPTGLLVLACFYFVRRPVCNLLPQPHSALLQPLVSKRVPIRFRELAAATLSILLGAWSHAVWDLSALVCWSLHTIPGFVVANRRHSYSSNPRIGGGTSVS
jgi:hypothetical protein